ncbi:MAG: ERF family protein [Actinobacteria bacterium]|nr:ERF family protein [Actinomycetota bacterium]
MNIYQKLIEVRKTVPYLKKENEGYQFKFVSSSQTLAALKAKMDELQLLLIPSVTSKNLIEKNQSGSKEHLTELEMDFKWVNAENPEEFILCHWYGQGLDTGEKGVGKALTYAEKYFMLKFFNIPTDKDDPDSFQEKLDNKNSDSKTTTARSTAARSKDMSGKVTTDQLKRMYTMITNAEIDEEKFKEWLYKQYKIKSSKELTKVQMEEVFKILEKKVEKMQPPADKKPPEDNADEAEEDLDQDFDEWVDSENAKTKAEQKAKKEGAAA